MRPFHRQGTPGFSGEGVVREDGLVLDFGLFPASDLAAEVLVESSGSPLGYGSWRLPAGELGNLWDIPILFLNSLSDTEITSLMVAICTTPPSKLLHTRADVLLTSVFRGGCRGTEGDGDGKGDGLGVVPGPVPEPHPCSDKELGLIPASKRHCTAGSREDFALAEEVTKRNTQKADNTAVPDHLWLRAFVLGYGAAGCAALHLEALGLGEGNQGHLNLPGPPDSWQGALPGLWSFALRYWRSRVTRGYISWHQANVPLPPKRGDQLVR